MLYYILYSRGPACRDVAHTQPSTPTSFPPASPAAREECEPRGGTFEFLQQHPSAIEDTTPKMNKSPLKKDHFKRGLHFPTINVFRGYVRFQGGVASDVSDVKPKRTVL